LFGVDRAAGAIKHQLRRRSAVEPVISHMKGDGHLGRCYLKGRAGDAANAVLSAVGYNLRLVLKWLRDFLRRFLAALFPTFVAPSVLNPVF
jgi:IS5 family transposase